MFSVDVQPSLDSRCIGLSSHLFQNNSLTNICRPQAGILLLDHCQPQTSCASALERDTKNDYHHLFPIRTEMKCTDFVEGEQMLKCQTPGSSQNSDHPCSAGPAALGACPALLEEKGWHCLLTWLHVTDFSCSVTSLFFILSPAESPEVNVYFLCMVSSDKTLQANIAAPRCQPDSTVCCRTELFELTLCLVRLISHLHSQ